MATISAKNLLQEHYQKLNLPPPIYDCKRVGGEDHTPIWQSTVTIHTGEKFRGEKYPKKTDADISAAQEALKKVVALDDYTFEAVDDAPATHKSPTISAKIPTQPKASEPDLGDNHIGIFIDGDNCPTVVDALTRKKLHPNVHVRVFVAKTHALATKPIPDHIKRTIVDSAHRDATDTVMIMYMGAYLMDQTFDKYIIVTKDHFGASLVEAIKAVKRGSDKKPYIWHKRDAVVCSDLPEIEMEMLRID